MKMKRALYGIMGAVGIMGVVGVWGLGMIGDAHGQGKAGAAPEWWLYEWGEVDFTKASTSLGEFATGGVGKDGIPPIYEPRFVSVEEASFGDVEGLDLGEKESVVALELNGELRAYPLRILLWHEIVNDVVGGEAVGVTFCPLCNSAVAFERTVGGRELKFGVSGMLRNSDLVMWNHGWEEGKGQEGWWQQFTGECLVGWCVGEKLKLIPSRLESWGEFMKRAPEAKVLAPPSGISRPYGRNPYVRYDGALRPFLYGGELPKGIAAMARVASLGKRGAVSLELLREQGEVTLGDGTRLVWTGTQASALDADDVREGREVGMVEVYDATGEAAVHDVVFAFVQTAFYPGSTVATKEEELSGLDE